MLDGRSDGAAVGPELDGGVVGDTDPPQTLQSSNRGPEQELQVNGHDVRTVNTLQCAASAVQLGAVSMQEV